MDNETTEQAAAADLQAVEGVAKKKLMVFGAILVATMAAAAGGGYMASRMVNGGGGGGGHGEGGGGGHGSTSQPAGGGADESAQYINLEPIIVNADDPKLQRYIRAVICLVVSKENHAHVNELMTKHKDEVRNGLVAYLSGCTLEQVRGRKNLNRVRREILDMVNEQFWPNQKPRINNVLFKEFQVQ